MSIYEIDHPAIASCEKTCGACPEQYEGTLTDGREFYLRYRYGRAQLGVGPTLDDAVWATCGRPPGAYAETSIGGDMQGIFDDADQRDRVFAELYAGLTEVASDA